MVVSLVKTMLSRATRTAVVYSGVIAKSSNVIFTGVKPTQVTAVHPYLRRTLTTTPHQFTQHGLCSNLAPARGTLPTLGCSRTLLVSAVVNQLGLRNLSTSEPLNLSTPPQKGIQSSISSLQAKKRAVRKRITKPDGEPDSSTVIAYATAEEYNLETLSRALQKQGLYQPGSMPEDVHDVLHVSAKYQVGREPREVYFFREGSAVFWNVPDLERESVLKFISAFEENSYNSSLVVAENEVIEYTYTDNKTRLVNGRILLNSEGSTDLEKYTFSNAMALSVKLALWEASLDRYVDTIEFVTEDMKLGKKITMGRQQVLQKMGELFALRHLINLSSDLLDTPDFYWDRETLEALYHKTCNHLNIAKRTKVMNEKLNHCKELIQLLSDHLSDRHHVRLEWMIIALIMVEVLFEVVHVIEKVL